MQRGKIIIQVGQG